MASATKSDDAGDLAYDAVYSGAVGGCVVAALFLIIDTLNGHPLHTPSMMGQILFGHGGVDSSAVQMDMVAYFSLVHLAAFAVLGVGVSLLFHRTALRSGHPGIVMLIFFAVFELIFYLGALVVEPRVFELIGLLPIALANLMAAVSMTLFMVNTARPEFFREFGRRLHLVH